jgi:hypothetical protein
MDYKESTKMKTTERSPVIQALHQKVDLSQQGASSAGKPNHYISVMY